MTKPKILEFRFFPIVDFEWFREDTQTFVGQYLIGASYNCTREPRHDTLRAMCAKWQEEGKIKIVPLTNGAFKTLKVGA